MEYHRFLPRFVAVLSFFRLAFTVAFHFPAGALTTCPSKVFINDVVPCGARVTTKLSMGLYEDEIDWDADLFGQIGKSDNKQSLGDGGGVIGQNDGGVTGSEVLDDDSQWDMGQSEPSKSMREQMKQSWGRVDKLEEEGKPTADWMPRFGSGPDEDEPWFTG
mmetsp:Transcript_20598/g.31263  ORF Transcript_20598/g.31263 Transcript_20598/m.31263 type:complete len:162 (+) Transcript_20598:364-849(+)